MISFRAAATLWLVLAMSLTVVVTFEGVSSKEVKMDPRLSYPELMDAKDLGTGITEEAVSYETGGGDVFFVPLDKWERLRVSVILEVGGEIRVSSFFLDDARRDLDSFTVSAGNLSRWVWKNDLGINGVYLKIEGWGQYRLDVHKDKDLVEVFMKEYLNLSLLLIIMVGLILSVLLVSAAIYLRTISFSMSHGFENDNDKRTKIADRSHRYDQLPFHRLPDGTERMVLPRMDPCEEDLSKYDEEHRREIEHECDRMKRYRTNATIIANRPIRPKKVVIDGKEHLNEVANAPIMPRRDLSGDVTRPPEAIISMNETLPSLPPYKRHTNEWS